MPQIEVQKKLPVFRLSIDPEDDDVTGVTVISLVNEPAIMVDFQKFSAAKRTASQFAISNEERRIVSGPALIPDVPIYRSDASGEYYVYFDKASIERIVDKFFKTSRNNNVDLEHDGCVLNGIHLFESFVVDSSRGVKSPTKYEGLPDGTWFVSYRIESDKVWNLVKSGDFKGFSVSGIFDHITTGMTFKRKAADTLQKFNGYKSILDLKI